jgi:diguanylate cyclase (GGDEF)-like protein
LKVANGILELFLEPLALTDSELKVTVSIGAALYPDAGTDIPTLRKQSDEALYEAKRLGRNRVVFSSNALSIANALSTPIEDALV